jgi:hypothetical protein
VAVGQGARRSTVHRSRGGGVGQVWHPEDRTSCRRLFCRWRARAGEVHGVLVACGLGWCRCFTGYPPWDIPKVVSFGEEMPRSGTRRRKEHKT